MLAAQSAASLDSADASFQAVDAIIASYGRKKAVGKTGHRKKNDVVSENVSLHQRVTKLLHQKLVQKAANDMKMQAVQSKLKRLVCFLNELSYIYFDAMNYVIFIWLLFIVSIDDYFW